MTEFDVCIELTPEQCDSEERQCIIQSVDFSFNIIQLKNRKAATVASIDQNRSASLLIQIQVD